MSLEHNTVPFPCGSGISSPRTLKMCSSAHRKKSRATLENYYRIVFALVRGDSHRPRLPTELVVLICRHADFTCPFPNKELSARRRWTGYRERYTGSNIDSEQLIPLLKTAPLSMQALRSARMIEMVVQFRRDLEYKVSITY